MASPNPFAGPVATESAYEGRRTQTPLTVSDALDQDTPQYPPVPPLSCVIYRRGNAAFRLNPYSREHAYLTGHFGTPSARATFVRELSTIAEFEEDRDYVGTPSTTQSEPDWDEVKASGYYPCLQGVQAFAHLLPSPGDVPAQVTMRSIGRVRTRDKRSCAEGATMLESASNDNPALAVEEKELASPASPLILVELRRSRRGRKSSGVEDRQVEVDTKSPGSILIGRQTPQPPLMSPFNQGVEADHHPAEAGYATEPVEHNHRGCGRFSPYNLRVRHRRALARQTEHVRAIGLPFDDFILRQTGVKRFNPKVPRPTQIDLLYDCGSSTGRGITIPQFGRVFTRCMDCNRFVLATRAGNRGHACDARSVDVNVEGFHFTEYFFEERCLGLTDRDLKDLLVVCDTCLRIHLTQHTDWHKCPDTNGDLDFIDDE